MGINLSAVQLVECGSCGNLGLGQTEIVCCGRPMEPNNVEDSGVKQPSLEELMRTVFDMSETELDICLCVMESGELTVAELAEQIDYDRSVVARHLNHLAELGVVDKRRRLIEKGGHVFIYSPKEPEAVRRQLKGVFLIWVEEATSLIDSLSREKAQAIVESDTQEPQWKIYQA